MANNYTTTTAYPPLPLLASRVNDNPAPAIVANTPLNEQDMVAAETQHNARIHLRGEKRKLAVDMENTAGHGVDPPALATIQATLNALAATINHPVNGLAALAATINHPVNGLAALAATINHPVHGLVALNRRVGAESIRNVNRSSIRGKSGAITPLPNAAGVLPGGWFPATPNHIRNATANQIDPLLAFYGLILTGNLGVRKERLSAHLGDVTQL